MKSILEKRKPLHIIYFSELAKREVLGLIIYTFLYKQFNNKSQQLILIYRKFLIQIFLQQYSIYNFKS